MEEYIRGPYLEQKADANLLDRLITEVLPIFKAFYLKKGWPYEIIDREPVQNQENLSFSTNSMILFTMALSMGILKRSSLFPSNNHPRELLKSPYHFNIGQYRDFEDTFIKAFREIIRESVKKYGLDIKKPVTYSESFGDDDPLTLSWLTEIFANADSKMPSGRKIEDINIKGFNQFRKKLAQRAYTMLKNAFNKPQEPFLQWKSQRQTRTHKSSVDHAFPLLRAVHLYSLLNQMTPSPIGRILPNLKPILLKKVRPHFLSFVHQHLSYHDITNSAFDTAELVFSLEGLLLIDNEAMSVDKHLLEQQFVVEGGDFIHAGEVSSKIKKFLLAATITFCDNTSRLSSLTFER